MFLTAALASPTGFEPMASGLGILRSIRLSYGDVRASIPNPRAGVSTLQRRRAVPIHRG